MPESIPPDPSARYADWPRGACTSAVVSYVGGYLLGCVLAFHLALWRGDYAWEAGYHPNCWSWPPCWIADTFVQAANPWSFVGGVVALLVAGLLRWRRWGAAALALGVLGALAFGTQVVFVIVTGR